MPPSDLIPKDLAEMIAGPFLMILSVRDDRFRATIARGLGNLRDDGKLDIFVSAMQWPDTVANAAPDGDIALTFVDPASYRCWQVKGVIGDIDMATPSETARAHLHMDRVLALLESLGVTRQQLAHSLCITDLRRLRVDPREVFNQTPGPGAGNRILGGTA